MSRLTYTGSSWYAEIEVKTNNLSDRDKIITCGYTQASEAVGEAQSALMKHVAELVTSFNTWLETLEQGGLKHGVTEKHILILTKEEFNRTIVFNKDSITEV